MTELMVYYMSVAFGVVGVAWAFAYVLVWVYKCLYN